MKLNITRKKKKFKTTKLSQNTPFCKSEVEMVNNKAINRYAKQSKRVHRSIPVLFRHLSPKNVSPVNMLIAEE